jgi:hypothetical protein
MDETTIELLINEAPAVIVIVGVLLLAWVTLGVLERALQRHDKKEDDDGSCDD